MDQGSFTDNDGKPIDNGQFFVAFDPGKFSGETFDQTITALIASITEQEGARLPNARREAGRKNSTINPELSLLSIAIRYGQKELEWDIPNPVSGRKLPEPEGRDRWITRQRLS